MKQIYIVLEGGCIRYVSTTDRNTIKNVGVTLIDLDDLDLGKEESAEFKAAEAAVRIW